MILFNQIEQVFLHVFSNFHYYLDLHDIDWQIDPIIEFSHYSLKGDGYYLFSPALLDIDSLAIDISAFIIHLIQSTHIFPVVEFNSFSLLIDSSITSSYS